MGEHSAKPDVLQEIFAVPKPIIGMVHSLPLPGAPRFKHHDLDDVYRFGVEEALRLKEGGVDGLLLENAGDIPFSKPEDIGHETVAAMSVLGKLIREETGLPLGIITVANGALPSLAIAKACGARFVRVNQWVNAYIANEGFVEGISGRAARYRSWIEAETVKIFADVHVKHGSHAIVADRPLSEQAKDAEFFDADVLIATGYRTGDPTPVGEVQGIRQHVSLPVIVGSGLNVDNCRALLSVADGAILGSSIKEAGIMHSPVSVEKVQALIAVVREIRQEMSEAHSHSTD
ncbi:MAG: BtpA/SgcQ family protein [Chloroflexi bacterium]|nr:BtpA/SgcQ family protein [Chloroflexota bacterium]